MLGLNNAEPFSNDAVSSHNNILFSIQSLMLGLNNAEPFNIDAVSSHNNILFSI